MDIRPPIVQIPIFALTKYQRSQILQRITIPSSPVFYYDIIDCVEVEAGKHSAANPQIVSYKSLSHHLIKEKGTFIDIRI
jgi:hypothetical protein